STSRSDSEYRRYQRTAQRISSGAVCRHLNIAGRVAFFTISSDYQPPPPKLQHIQFKRYFVTWTELGPLRARRGPLTEVLKRRTLPGDRREPHSRVEDAPQRIYLAAWLGKKRKSSAFRWSWISLSHRAGSNGANRMRVSRSPFTHA